MNSARLKLRLPWKTRRGLVNGITSGFLVPTLYLAWHTFGWPEPIRISDETTRLTEPLTEDGYVDYIHCFRSQLKLNNEDYVNDSWLTLLRNEEEARLPARLHQKRPQPPGTSGIVYREPVEFYREMVDEDPNSVTGDERLRGYETEVMDGRLRRPFSTIDDPAAATAIAAWYRANIAEPFRSSPGWPCGDRFTVAFLSSYHPCWKSKDSQKVRLSCCGIRWRTQSSHILPVVKVSCGTPSARICRRTNLQVTTTSGAGPGLNNVAGVRCQSVLSA